MGIGRMAIVYCYTSPSNKKYIGITYKDRETLRKSDHRSMANRGEGWRFHDAIRKYGFDLFDYKVLCLCFTWEDALNVERLYIQEYDTCNPKYGYNISEGGVGFSNIADRNSKISKSLTGRKLSDEHKEKIRIYQSGKRMSKESKQKISRPVLKFDLDGNFIERYSSIKEAKIANNNAKVWRVCNNEQRQSKGFVFKYEKGE